VVGSCEHGNEPLSSIKGEGFLEYLSNFWFLKDCVPWSLLHDVIPVSLQTCSADYSWKACMFVASGFVDG
jgi:hypothetical protein